MIVGSHSSRGLGLLAFPALAILLGVPAVWAWVYLTRRRRNMRLTLDASTLHFTNWNGKGWHIPRDEIAQVDYMDVLVPMNTKPTPWVIIGGGATAHVLWQSDWPDAGLVRMWKQIGCETSRDAQPTREVLRRYPSLDLPWWHRHPVLGGLLGAVAIIGYSLLVVMPFVLITT